MRLAKILRISVLALVVLGMVLRLTVADGSGILRAVYYGMPMPVLAAGWLTVAVLWNWRSNVGIASSIFALACFVEWNFQSSCEPKPADGRKTVLKVLCWNMAHRKLPNADLQTLLETFKPDVVGLVEVGSRHGDPSNLVDSLPPGYTATKLDHGMAIVTRGTARVVQKEVLPSLSKFNRLEVTVDGVAWHVFIVDGASRPTRSREDVLTRVLAEARSQPRTLVVGDFNTPIESPLFNPWRTELLHAFNESGSGLRETWPRYVPVLTIDHVWSSHDVPPLRTEKRWLKSSDHAALLVELRDR